MSDLSDLSDFSAFSDDSSLLSFLAAGASALAVSSAAGPSASVAGGFALPPHASTKRQITEIRKQGGGEAGRIFCFSERRWSRIDVICPSCGRRRRLTEVSAFLA